MSDCNSQEEYDAAMQGNAEEAEQAEADAQAADADREIFGSDPEKYGLDDLGGK